MGGVLQQKVAGECEPISFFCRKLNKRQQNYSTFSKELYVAYVAMKSFRFFVEATQFYILTDHQPLNRAIFAIFTNLIEDTLAIEQSKYNELPKIIAGKVLCTPTIKYVDGIFCHATWEQLRPYVPANLRKKVFSDYHELMISEIMHWSCGRPCIAVGLITGKALIPCRPPEVTDCFPNTTSPCSSPWWLGGLYVPNYIKDLTQDKKKTWEKPSVTFYLIPFYFSPSLF